MDNETDILVAKSVMGENFIGPDELKRFSIKEFMIKKNNGRIPFSKKELEEQRENYILIYGASTFVDGTPVTIRQLKKLFDNQKNSPVFYNQDWYEKEDFIDRQLEEGWFLIRKNVYEDSRAISPDVLSEKVSFPSAISCCYAFFVSWICLNIRLWYEDFVWCSDFDHNNDRIYVGKYHDIEGINNDGFSIHRHLALRNCYACID